MRSPFPGMDPYLEDRWRDVHSSFVLYARDQLQSQVTPALRARVEERVVLDIADDDRGPPFFYPDVKIVDPRRDKPPLPDLAATNTALVDPVVALMGPSEITERFVEIVEAGGGRVVTVIEFLSPSNKRRGRDREAYIAKQQQLVASDVALVEIDLLRAGRRTMQHEIDYWPKRLREMPYAACASRPDESRRAEMYGFSLRQRLPAIRIPLRPGDRDAVLDLQLLIDLAYSNGAYDGDLDYTKPPVPPLSPDDETWADAQLRAAGKRGEPSAA